MDKLLETKKAISLDTKEIKALLENKKTRIIKIARGKNYKVDYVPEDYNEQFLKNVGSFYYFTKEKTVNKWKETLNFYDANSLNDLTKAMIKNKDFPFNIEDILYIKEKYQTGLNIRTVQNIPLDESIEVLYYENEIESKNENNKEFAKIIKWNSSKSMPNELARIFIKIKNVRVEKLQDISIYDAIKELGKGFIPLDVNCEYENHIYKTKKLSSLTISNKDFKTWDEWLIVDFIKKWNSNAKDGYKWEDNPIIFIYDFEVVQIKH